MDEVLVEEITGDSDTDTVLLRVPKTLVPGAAAGDSLQTISVPVPGAGFRLLVILPDAAPPPAPTP